MYLLIKLSCIFIFIIRYTNAANLRSGKTRDATENYYKKLISGDTSKLSELNMFVTAMPKGGDLHHHYSGSIYAEAYLDWVAENNFCIYREDNEALNIQKYGIESQFSTLSNESKALCITADAVRQDNSFYRELLKRWSDIDYANHYHEQPPPDKQFFDTFGYFDPLVGNNYNKGFKWLKNTAIAENVQYIETMLQTGPNPTVPDSLNNMVDRLTSKSSDIEIDEALTEYFNTVISDETVNTTITNFVESIKICTDGIDDDNFTLRLQLYVFRGESPSRVFGSLFSSMSAAIKSDLIVGVNIVGAENGIIAMRDYTLHMKMFRFLKQRMPHVNLAMHAGELVLGLVPPESLQFHIREAIEIAGAQRIGHGIDIFYEYSSYELLRKMKDLKIVVEVIISSNEFILGIKNAAHPLLVYKAHGVPFIIATDDPGVSRSTMSNEYLMYSDRYKPSYDELKELAYSSIRFSFLSDSDKKAHLDKLDARFLKFEAMIADVAATLGDSGIISSSSSFKITLLKILLWCSIYLLKKLNFL